AGDDPQIFLARIDRAGLPGFDERRTVLAGDGELVGGRLRRARGEQRENGRKGCFRCFHGIGLTWGVVGDCYGVCFLITTPGLPPTIPGCTDVLRPIGTCTRGSDCLRSASAFRRAISAAAARVWSL